MYELHLVYNYEDIYTKLPMHVIRGVKSVIKGNIYETLLSIDDNISYENIHLISKIHTYTSFDMIELSQLKLTEDNIIDKTCYDHKTYHIIWIPNSAEIIYLTLLRNVMKCDLTSSRNSMVKSKFGCNMKFDLRIGFPLLTTKRVPFRFIVEELLFFLRGDTNTKILEEKGIHIWSANTSEKFLKEHELDYPEGEMGPMYGYQWRHNGDSSFDQLKYVIDTIKLDPKSRRIIMTTFSPYEADKGVLYPCHSIVNQFYIQDNHIDMYVYNRSSDLLLGLPFNIASSALLLEIIGNVCGYTPRFMNLSIGDHHIYENHFKAVEEQLERIPFKFPTLKIKRKITEKELLSETEEITHDDFELIGYIYHPKLTNDTTMVP